MFSKGRTNSHLVNIGCRTNEFTIKVTGAEGELRLHGGGDSAVAHDAYNDISVGDDGVVSVKLDAKLGALIKEIGKLSKAAQKPEMVSGICAVLAETDVINMVSRGISPGDILKGIHQAIAKRLINLLRALKATGVVLITGGLAADVGFIAVMQELADAAQLEVKIDSHEKSVHAGAIGAAIWAAFRHVKLGGDKIQAA